MFGLMGVARMAGQPGGSVPGYDVILLAGQSNMVGAYGPIDGVLDATDPSILQYGYDSETVTLASDPLDHVSESANKVGMGLSFAKAYLAANPGRTVLLVPCADTSTSFASGYWRDGGTGYETAVLRANAAMAETAPSGGANRLAAILWHQGESDSPASEAVYAADLDALVWRFRADLTGASLSTPFVCGDLMEGWEVPASNGVRAGLENVVDRVAYTACVDTTGLADGGDGLHFSAASQRTLGGLYFTALASAEANTPTVPGTIADLGAIAGDTEVTLGWTAPAANKAPIADYLVEYKASASGTWLTFSDSVSASASAVVTGLTNGTPYDFRVSAINAVGTGAASNVDSATPDAVPAFAPDDIAGMWGWWDFSDASTLYDTAVGGSLVGADGTILRVEDKSGSGLHLTATNGPIRRVAVHNGMDCAEFDGTNDALTDTNSGTLRNVAAGCLVLIAKRDSTAATSRFGMYVSTSSSSSARAIIWAGATSNRNSASGRTLNADGLVTINSGTDVGTSVAINIAAFDYANTDLTLYQNGAQVAQTTSFQSATATSDTDAATVSIGGRTGTFWDGDICEAIIYHAIPTSGELAQLNAYAQSKWGTP